MHLLIGHIGHAETLVRSPRRWSVKPCMAGKHPPPLLTAHSTGVDCIFTLVLPCETFAESSDDQLHSAWGITEPFVLGDEMTESGGLVRLPTSRSQHVSLSRLEFVGSDEGHDSAIRSVCLFCHRTPTSATFCQDAKYKNISLSAKIGFLQPFLND